MSLKSTKLLKNALNALEQNDIHMLVWRGTSMARFLDGCKQSSNVVFWCPSDTLIAGKIRGDWGLSSDWKVSSNWNYFQALILSSQTSIFTA